MMKKKNSFFLPIFIVFLLLILIFALSVLAPKIEMEKRVFFTIGLFFEDIEKLSLVTGINYDSLLMSLKNTGVEYIVVSPASLQELANIGKIEMFSTSQNSYKLLIKDESLVNAIVIFLKRQQVNFGFSSANTIFLRSYQPILEKIITTPFFYPDVSSERLSKTGLKVVYIISGNSYFLKEDYISLLGKLQPLPYRVPLLIKGEKKDFMVPLSWLVSYAEKMNNFLFLNLEFERDTAHQEIKRYVSSESVYLAHSLKLEENEKYSLNNLYHRWIRAVRERNVKFLLPRLFLLRENKKKIISFNRKYLSSLVELLRKRGYKKIGKLEKWKFLAEKNYLKLLLWGLFTGLMILLLSEILTTPLFFIFSGVLIFILFLAMIAFNLKYTLFQEMVAFFIALSTPILSSYWLWKKKDNLHIGILLEIFSFIVIASISLQAILFSPQFYLKLRMFRGVKASFLLPLLFWMGIFIWKQKLEFRVYIKEILFTNIKVYHLLSLVGIFVFFLLYLSRSGNFPLIPVAHWEVSLRDFLEDILGVRPRFKEIFLGYPALVLFYLWETKKINVSLPEWVEKILIFMITIGFISVINTYEHIHTPLYISLLRTLNGVILGVSLILVPFFLSRFFFRAQQLKEELQNEY